MFWTINEEIKFNHYLTVGLFPTSNCYLHQSVIHNCEILAGSEGSIGENKRRQMKEKQDELEIEKAKEALLKKQRPLEVSVFKILADSYYKWYYWWLVEVPYWCKVSFNSRILRFFTTRGQIDNFTRGKS